MSYLKNRLDNENGFVLITSLMMLVVLMIIGIAATNTTTIELRISGNDKVTKQTFYQAEGGTQAGVELVEDNIIQALFTSNTAGAVYVNTMDLYLNENPTPATSPTDAEWNNPDAYFPSTAAPPIVPRTDLIFKGSVRDVAGDPIHMNEGYSGPSSGRVRVYDIWSRHSGYAASDATVVIKWNHRIR